MLTVLIVGCGNIAGGFDRARSGPPLTHAGAYSAHGGFSMTACIDPDRAKREAFMSRWSVPLGFASVAEAQATGLRCDVVSICSPTAEHFADAMAALRLGPRLIFCEKPATVAAAQTRELAAHCAAAGVLLAVNYIRRWDSEVHRLAQELRRGDWGAIRSTSAWYNKGLLNNGSHMIDLLHLLLGQLVPRYAGPPMQDMLPDDPSVPAMLSAPQGVAVQLNCGDARDFALFELELATVRGVIRMEDGGMRWRTRTAAESPDFAGYRTLTHGQFHPGGLLQTMSAAVAEIHQVLSVGGTLSSTATNAIETQAVCEALLAMANSHPPHIES